MRPLAALLVGAMTATAHAGLIERTAALDLKAASLPGPSIDETVFFDTVSLTEGDRFIFDLNFTNGALRVIDLGGPSNEALSWFFADGSGQTGFVYDLTVTLKGVSGTVLSTSLSGNFGGPIGGFFVTNLTDTTFRYSGMTLDFSIIFKEPARLPFVASDMVFRQQFFTPAIGEGGGLLARVPEPSTLGLLGAGLLGLFFRRKRAA